MRSLLSPCVNHPRFRKACEGKAMGDRCTILMQTADLGLPSAAIALPGTCMDDNAIGSVATASKNALCNVTSSEPARAVPASAPAPLDDPS